VHIVGSNNNLEARDAAASREFYERDAANIAWIQSAFADAASQNPSLIVLAFQADVFDSKSIYEDFPSWSGFRQSIGETLLPLAQRWGKPVLVIHGDSHKFKLDQPFSLNRQPLSNITRLIVPGASDVRAVKVTVQPSAALSFELISPAP
jgi:thiol-disulfide isomerase/thioredoxin